MTNNYETIIASAKQQRAKGNMLECINLVNEIEEPTGESIRLMANALIDLDCPYSAGIMIYNEYNALPDSEKSEVHEYKNLDVKARVAYKQADYEYAMDCIYQKMSISEDKSREYPFLLWIATVGRNIEVAMDIASTIMKGKKLTDLNPYELKSITLYDRLFNLRQYRKNPTLIDMCLQNLGDLDTPSKVDNGPWCYVLANIDYMDKTYIVKKFMEQEYCFEASCVDTIIGHDLLDARRRLFNEDWFSPHDKDRENYYIYAKTIEDMRDYGIFPL